MLPGLTLEIAAEIHSFVLATQKKSPAPVTRAGRQMSDLDTAARLLPAFCGQTPAYPQDRMCETGRVEHRQFIVQLTSPPDASLVQQFEKHVNP